MREADSNMRSFQPIQEVLSFQVEILVYPRLEAGDACHISLMKRSLNGPKLKPSGAGRREGGLELPLGGFP